MARKNFLYSFSHQQIIKRRPEDGLSLLEVVISVAIIAVFSVVGIIGFQQFTDNARQAAVDTAANDVFIAAVAHNAFPAHVTTEDDEIEEPRMIRVSSNIPLFTATQDPTLQKIADDFNRESSDVQVTIGTDNGQNITVVATGWQGDYVAVRSTIDELNHSNTIPPGFEQSQNVGNDTDTEQPTPEQEDTPGIMALSWSTDISKEVALPIGGIQGDLKIDWGDGTVTEGTTTQHTYDADTRGIKEIRIEGKFDSWGSINKNDKIGIISVDEWKNTGTTNLYYGFRMAQNLQHIAEIPSGVENMESMLSGAISFDQDISDWDVSQVTNMMMMFNGATAFNNGDEPLDWQNTSRVTIMSGMFYGATSFNQDVSSWNTSNVTKMDRMFLQARSFNQDIHEWDVSKVQRMDYMFKDAESFNQPLHSWDVSNVQNMNNMFNGATHFNQDISSWDVSHVTNMNYLFYNASSFNQDISSWKVPKISSKPLMYFDTGSHPEFLNNAAKQPQWGVS